MAEPIRTATDHVDDDDDDDEILGEAPVDDDTTSSVAVSAAAAVVPPSAPQRVFADALQPVVIEAPAVSSSSSWSSWSSWVSSSVSAVSDIAASALSETSKAIDNALRDDSSDAADTLKEVATKRAPPEPNRMRSDNAVVASAPSNAAASDNNNDDNDDDDDTTAAADDGPTAGLAAVVDGVDSIVGGLMGAIETGVNKLSVATEAQLSELSAHADLAKVSKVASGVMDSSFSVLERVGARAFDLLTVRETSLDQPGEQRVAARFAVAAPSASAAPTKSAATAAASAPASDDFHSIFDAAMGGAHAEALERLSMHATLRTQRLLGALDANARAEAAKVQRSLTRLFDEDEDEDEDEAAAEDDAKPGESTSSSSLPAKALSVQTQLLERAAAARAELQSAAARVAAELGDESADSAVVAENAKRVLRATLSTGVAAMASCAALATEVLLRTGEAAMVDVTPDEPTPRAEIGSLRLQAGESARAAQALAQAVQQIASDVVAASTAVRTAARARLAGVADAAQSVDDAATAAVKDAYLQAGRAVQHITSARQFLAPIWATLAL
jgi:hypothetical protein